MLLGTDLEVETGAAVPVEHVSFLIDVERRIGTAEGNGRWLSLALEIGEIVGAVLFDWAAEGTVESLVFVRQHTLLDEVGGIETAVAKAARETPRCHIGSGLGHSIHENTVGP